MRSEKRVDGSRWNLSGVVGGLANPNPELNLKQVLSAEIESRLLVDIQSSTEAVPGGGRK